MAIRANSIWNTDDIHYFAEDILNRYYLSIGDKNVSEVVRKYIYKIGETCAGILSEDEVWDIVKVLQENECITDEILKKSSIQKFTRVKSPIMNENIKEELIDLASNKIIKHVNKREDDIKEYITKCLTIESKKTSVSIGELECTLEYSEDGFGLNQIFNKNQEGCIDFAKNNVLIKIKEDVYDGIKNKHVRLIVIKSMEKLN